ncbi:MAG: hypothetical protein K8H88_08990, partial [Sandaracinaceae bacterium]|nr:hypothetical protein [Sandaracinaceae bacterium]
MRETTHALNGIRLHVREGEGSGPPLLLLHGFSGAGSDFGHLFDLDALSERSIAVDLRGLAMGQRPRSMGRAPVPAQVDGDRALAQRVEVEEVPEVAARAGEPVQQEERRA